jgi:hypothetical protein
MERTDTMGKLIEKLHQVGQSSGNRLGFMGRAETAASKPRPAAVLVALNAGDSVAADSIVKAGVDAVLIKGWIPGADISQVSAVLESSHTVWGVEFNGAPSAAEGIQKAASLAGAAFVLVGPSAPAAVLFDEDRQLDLVVAVDAPKDDLGLLLLRAENLLQAQAALVQLPLSPALLGNLTVSEFARLRLVFESLRFPALVMLNEMPEVDGVKALVHLGVDGIMLATSAGKSEAALGKQVQSLLETLQALPVHESRRSSVAIGGFMSGAGSGETLLPRRPGRPSPEPDEE